METGKSFYREIFNSEEYASSLYAEAVRPGLQNFLKQYNLQKARLLDVGCGRAWFQDLNENWVGLDISETVGRYAKHKFICGSAEYIPLKNECIDAIWSITFLEHSLDPEKALLEMVRVLSDGGVIYMAPAWRVPPWRPKVYEIKRFYELNAISKIYKTFLPLFNFIWMKGIFWIPRRLIKELSWALSRKPTRLKYVAFAPNLKEFLLPDSDARNSLDNHEVLLWFLSRGFIARENRNWFKRIFIRCGPITVIKRNNLAQ